MSEFEIVRGVGVPPPGQGNARYPFHDLAVGDGFYAPIDGRRVRSAAVSWGRKHGRKFRTRKQADGRILVVRVS